MGRLTTDQTLVGLGMQLIWSVIVLVLCRFLWDRAIRQYTAVGA
jgi:ABC-type uncharacterized transport system permease subunit